MNPQKQEFDAALANLTPEERKKYTESNPTVGVGGVQQTFSNSVYTDAPSTITSEDLTTTEQPMNLTTPKASTGMSGLGASLETQANTNQEQYKLSDTAKSQETAVQGSRNKIADFIAGRKTTTQAQDEIAAPTDTAEAELRDINNQILQEQQSNRRQQEETRKTFTGTMAGLQAELRRIDRESISKQADLAVIQMAKQGAYDSAKAIADRKVQALMEEQQNEFEALKFQYEENKDLFDKTEQRDYEAFLSNKEREIKKQETELNTISDLSINALENGAPAPIAAQMRSAKTVEDAMRIGGIYINKLDRDKAIRDANIKTLPPATQTRIQTIAGQFDNEQAVKSYQVTAEAIDAFNSAGNSPTDDISRIYAFAKVMDPNSAVREGEYKTIQDYSAALFERTGKRIQRVFDNSGFLTEEARNFMKDTLQNRLNSSKKAYDNIHSEYGRRINKVSGGTDGTEYITDYSRAFSESSAPQQTADIKVKAIYASRPELKDTIEKMVQDGYDWNTILQAVEEQ